MYNQTRSYGNTARRSNNTNSYRSRGPRKSAPRKQYIHPSAFVKAAKPQTEEELCHEN